ncbi:MAG: hypothetical protein K0S98_1502, partial [Propionibacteriaceae bacterium]|nr:hypothetical protein [Propionibacteriaceae bacterium]
MMVRMHEGVALAPANQCSIDRERDDEGDGKGERKRAPEQYVGQTCIHHTCCDICATALWLANIGL